MTKMFLVPLHLYGLIWKIFVIPKATLLPESSRWLLSLFKILPLILTIRWQQDSISVIPGGKFQERDPEGL